jgi:hypothetical protein
MASKRRTNRRPLNVVTRRGSAAQKNYRSTAGLPGGIVRVPADLANGFTPTPDEDLVFHGGRTIKDLIFVNYYIGGDAAWNASDRKQIDTALAAAMSDEHLNNVIMQYFDNQPVSAKLAKSEVLPGVPPKTFTQGDVEALVRSLKKAGALKGPDLTSTVFNFMLPPGSILTDDDATSKAKIAKKVAAIPKNPAKPDDEVSSLAGLGGYHGSVHFPSTKETVYYAIAVFSEKINGKENGIVAFDQPWKNVVATLVHEDQEARTDPDVEDAIKNHTAKGARFLGWMAASGNEIGDFPIEESGADLQKVMQEVPLANGKGTVPVQLMYSNYVHGPEGPIPHPHPAAASKKST